MVNGQVLHIAKKRAKKQNRLSKSPTVIPTHLTSKGWSTHTRTRSANTVRSDVSSPNIHLGRWVWVDKAS